MSSARAPRIRRPRPVRSTLALIVLSVEFLVVVLAALTLLGLRVVPPGVALGAGGAVLLLVVVAAGLSRSDLGIGLGWLVQVLLVAGGALEITIGIVGVLLGALWVYCMIVGGRIDRREAAAAPPA